MHISFTPGVLGFLFFTGAPFTTSNQTLLLHTFDVLLHDVFIHAHAMHLQMVQHVDITLISISANLHSAFWHRCCFAQSCQDRFCRIFFESCASVLV